MIYVAHLSIARGAGAVVHTVHALVLEELGAQTLFAGRPLIADDPIVLSIQIEI